MVKEIWKNLFESSVKEKAEIIAKEDIDKAVDMFTSDKIDPQVFISNLEILIHGYISPLNFSGVESKKPSSSVQYFNITRRAPAFPLWFYAAYPDVMKWFHEWQKTHIKSTGFGLKLTFETQKLLGPNFLWPFYLIFDIVTYLIRKSKQWKPRRLKRMVKRYKKTTGKTLEVMVDEYSESDIYTGQKILKSIGAESNFTLIATITTKFYLELKRSYGKHFTDRVSLFTAAGVLDAQYYIWSGEIKTEEILDIAKESIKSKNPFLDFIIDFEVKLLGIDTPNMTTDVIRMACEEQRENIKGAIQNTTNEYIGEPRFISDTKIFMESDRFKQIREVLGVK